MAIVQYAQKSQASEALKKLPFETSLGEYLDVDFYQSKESRLQEFEEKQGYAAAQNQLSMAAQNPLNPLT